MSAAAGATTWTRDRLLLFRRCGRGDWASRMKEQIEANSELGAGSTRVHRLLALGLPDLAARFAVRNGIAEESLKYPTPYAELVAGAARRFRIAPEWIWAIMRRESFFENAVVSPAGAVGLLQLMQPTAVATAERAGLPAGPLGSSRINVLLGTAHLRDLLEEESGQWPVVLAGYNAGIDNARRWRAAGDDLDVYIERIGYRETREYVPAVLETFWIYRELLRARQPATDTSGPRGSGDGQPEVPPAGDP